MNQAERDARFDEATGLMGEARYDDAIAILRKVAASVLTTKVATNLGYCLFNIGENDEAEHWIGVAARHRPEDPWLRFHLAQVFSAQGRVDHAELEFKTALVLKPDFAQAKLGLAGLYLSAGRYAQGWPLLETRVPLNPTVIPPVNVSFPEWTGQPLTGKSIMVWFEQGFGDQLQMCRFAQELKARGAAHVALGVRPPLVHLMSTLAAVDEVISVPQGGMVQIKTYDYWSRYFSLPHHLKTELRDVPRPAYLSAPADRREKWRGYSGVGLAWRASPTGFNGANKSLPPEQARRLLDLGAVSLDPEDTGVSDFADTAAIIEQLDLVISIDSAAAHLAGAMGKPVWTLLPAVHVDWRWLRERTDSPWYPSMRLYRQQRRHAWGELIDRVIPDLKAFRGK